MLTVLLKNADFWEASGELGEASETFK